MFPETLQAIACASWGLSGWNGISAGKRPTAWLGTVSAEPLSRAYWSQTSGRWAKRLACRARGSEKQPPPARVRDSAILTFPLQPLQPLRPHDAHTRARRPYRVWSHRADALFLSRRMRCVDVSVDIKTAPASRQRAISSRR